MNGRLVEVVDVVTFVVCSAPTGFGSATCETDGYVCRCMFSCSILERVKRVADECSVWWSCEVAFAVAVEYIVVYRYDFADIVYAVNGCPVFRVGRLDGLDNEA